MRYELTVGEAEVTVTATAPGPDGRGTLVVGDDVFQGRLAVGDGNRVVLGAEGAPREMWVALGADGLWTWCDGRARLVQDTNARRARRRGGGAGRAREVTPPMPAVVTNLLCAEGDHVTQGQGLVVVAAMKMEMTLTAPFAGTVTAVRAQVGAKVSPGEILVDIAPEPSEAGPDNAPDGGEG